MSRRNRIRRPDRTHRVIRSVLCGGWVGIQRPEGKRKDGDVVFLAELSSSIGDRLRLFFADRSRSFEPENFAGLAARFHDTVRKKSEAVARSKLDRGSGVLKAGHDSEGKAGVDRNLLAIPVGRRMAGVGE